jgi:hypothetical protein
MHTTEWPYLECRLSIKYSWPFFYLTRPPSVAPLNKPTSQQEITNSISTEFILIYEMHGNVCEWVEDDWNDSYEVAPAYCRGWTDNPRSTSRVVRGGSWYYDAPNCHSAVGLG